MPSLVRRCKFTSWRCFKLLHNTNLEKLHIEIANIVVIFVSDCLVWLTFVYSYFDHNPRWIHKPQCYCSLLSALCREVKVNRRSAGWSLVAVMTSLQQQPDVVVVVLSGCLQLMADQVARRWEGLRVVTLMFLRKKKSIHPRVFSKKCVVSQCGFSENTGFV